MGLLTRMHIELRAARREPNDFGALVKRYGDLALPILREISDPRGRCNRKAFLNIALTFLALQFGLGAVLWVVGIETSREGTFLLNAPVFWIGTSVCIKRLHDVGLRGWWIPGAFGIWLLGAVVVSMVFAIVLGQQAMAEGQPAFLVVFALITLPAFGALLWLHTAPSVVTANEFGPVPGATGLSMPTAREGNRRAFASGSALIA